MSLSPLVQRDFDLLVKAIKGERCPQTHPNGPISTASIPALYRLGYIRSEVSERNFRRVVILQGPHAGKGTAQHPNGAQPWKINGVDVNKFGRVSKAVAREISPAVAPPTVRQTEPSKPCPLTKAEERL